MIFKKYNGNKIIIICLMYGVDRRISCCQENGDEYDIVYATAEDLHVRIVCRCQALIAVVIDQRTDEKKEAHDRRDDSGRHQVQHRKGEQRIQFGRTLTHQTEQILNSHQLFADAAMFPLKIPKNKKIKKCDRKLSAAVVLAELPVR